MEAHEIRDKNYQDMLRPTEEGDMPVILAKYNGYMPDKYDTRQKHWQGLKARMINGKKIWDIVDNNFVLVIEKGTGHCRIPKTDKNLKMFEKFSKPKQEIRTEHSTDEDGNLVTKEVEVEVPGRFSRLEENVLQRSLGENLKDKVIQEIQERFDLVPKDRPKGEMPTVNRVVDTKSQKSEEDLRAEIEAKVRKEMEENAAKEKAEADTIAAAKKAADEAHKKEVLRRKRQEQAANMRKKKEEKQRALQAGTTQPAELVTSDSN